MKEWTYPFRTGSGPQDDAYWFLALRANGVYYFYRSAKDKFSYQTRDAETAKQLHFERFGSPNGFQVANKRRLTNDQGFELFCARLAKRGKKQKTIDGYKGTWYHHISPIRVAGGVTFGSRPIHRTDAEDMLAVLDAAKVAKKLVLVKGGKGRRELSDQELGASAKKHIDSVLSSAYTYFCQPSNRWALVDYTKQLGDDKPPKPGAEVAGEEACFSPEEIDLIAEHVGRSRYAVGRYAVCAYKRRVIALLSPEIGTRISETLAIELEDVIVGLVDIARGVEIRKQLHIKQQIRDGYKPLDRSTWFDTLKGKDDVLGDRPRHVPLSDFARELLTEYINRGLAEGWLRRGGLLFPTSRQTPIPNTDISEPLRKSAEAVGRRVRSHYFRHTYASNRIAHMPIQRLAYYLGHTPEMTRKVYGHWTDDPETLERDRNLGRKAVGS